MSEYGPVEIVLVGFDNPHPHPRVLAAITDLVDERAIRLLDLVILVRDDDGLLTILELEDAGEDYGLEGIDPIAGGIAAGEDIEALAEWIAPGAAAALLVVEMTWARELAQILADAGGFVVHSDRIPAPVVNAALTELGTIR